MVFFGRLGWRMECSAMSIDFSYLRIHAHAGSRPEGRSSCGDNRGCIKYALRILAKLFLKSGFVVPALDEGGYGGFTQGVSPNGAS